MINGLVSAALGCTLYGILNVVVARNCVGASALTTTTYFSAGVFATSLVAQTILRSSGHAPDPLKVPWYLILMIGMVYFCADFLYLNAFSQKAHILSITILGTLVPVVAAILTFGLDRTLPGVRHVLAFILAMAAVLVLPN